MVRLAANEARKEFAETLNRVAYKGERIIVHRHGKNVAALIPLEDLELLETIEDRIDLIDARNSLKEPGSIPWKKLKKELGI